MTWRIPPRHKCHCETGASLPKLRSEKDYNETVWECPTCEKWWEPVPDYTKGFHSGSWTWNRPTRGRRKRLEKRIK